MLKQLLIAILGSYGPIEATAELATQAEMVHVANQQATAMTMDEIANLLRDATADEIDDTVWDLAFDLGFIIKALDYVPEDMGAAIEQMQAEIEGSPFAAEVERMVELYLRIAKQLNADEAAHEELPDWFTARTAMALAMDVAGNAFTPKGDRKFLTGLLRLTPAATLASVAEDKVPQAIELVRQAFTSALDDLELGLDMISSDHRPDVEIANQLKELTHKAGAEARAQGKPVTLFA